MLHRKAFQRQIFSSMYNDKSFSGKCKDRLGSKQCKLRIRACDLPKLKDKMRHLCEATCGYCSKF